MNTDVTVSGEVHIHSSVHENGEKSGMPSLRSKTGDFGTDSIFDRGDKDDHMHSSSKKIRVEDHNARSSPVTSMSPLPLKSPLKSPLSSSPISPNDKVQLNFQQSIDAAGGPIRTDHDADDDIDGNKDDAMNMNMTTQICEKEDSDNSNDEYLGNHISHSDEDDDNVDRRERHSDSESDNERRGFSKYDNDAGETGTVQSPRCKCRSLVPRNYFLAITFFVYIFQ